MSRLQKVSAATVILFSLLVLCSTSTLGYWAYQRTQLCKPGKPLYHLFKIEGGASTRSTSDAMHGAGVEIVSQYGQVQATVYQDGTVVFPIPLIRYSDATVLSDGTVALWDGYSILSLRYVQGGWCYLVSYG
ncbi:MAG: hypothetical protein AAB443_04495 [Patescibacteria group bacterium]